MAFHQFQPRRGQAPMKIKPLRQFNSRQIFEPLQNEGLFDFAGGNLAITMFTRLKLKIVWRNSVPEAGIIHRLQPFFNVIDRAKFSHIRRITKPTSPAQNFCWRKA